MGITQEKQKSQQHILLIVRRFHFIQVLSEDFLAKVQDRHSKGKSVGVPALIQKMNIADWGSDPNERIGDIPDEFDNGVNKSAAEKLYCKSGSGKIGRSDLCGRC